MKATELLKHQHREVDALLATLEKTAGAAQRRALVAKVAAQLTAHMLIEQEIFYPACAAAADDDTLGEAHEEHAVASFELRRLMDALRDGEAFAARVTVLRELIKHHVEEEENELFPAAARKLSDARLAELGAAMAARFERALHADAGRVLRAQSVVSGGTRGAASRPVRTHAVTSGRRAAAKKPAGTRGAKPATAKKPAGGRRKAAKGTRRG